MQCMNIEQNKKNYYKWEALINFLREQNINYKCKASETLAGYTNRKSFCTVRGSRSLTDFRFVYRVSVSLALYL